MWRRIYQLPLFIAVLLVTIFNSFETESPFSYLFVTEWLYSPELGLLAVCLIATLVHRLLHL